MINHWLYRKKQRERIVVGAVVGDKCWMGGPFKVIEIKGDRVLCAGHLFGNKWHDLLNLFPSPLPFNDV